MLGAKGREGRRFYLAHLEDGSFILPPAAGENTGLDEYGRFVDHINRINETGMLFIDYPRAPIEWQRTMIPAVVLFSEDARGCVHRAITDLLGGTEKYYFQKARSGKVFLHKNRSVEPPDVGAHHEVRIKVAAAVAEWKAMTEEEKVFWKGHKEGKWRGLPGYQLFLSFKLRELV